jgi:uncharacterized repeat protein (TIGR03803 family)
MGELKLRLSKPRFLRTAFATLAVLSFISLTAHGRAFGATESILWSFDNLTDDIEPVAGLIIDNQGNLYSTTDLGGANSAGMVFELTPPSTLGGDWTESTLWSFGSGTDGSNPQASLIMDPNGNLFGTTFGGGINGSGTVFELFPPSTLGGAWTESVLWSFGNGNDGVAPQASLIMDGNGNLYGTTRGGGDNGDGAVFELFPPSTIGGTWTQSVLWSFGKGKGGFGPEAGVTMDKSGNLYGTTRGLGFRSEAGTVFELTPPATSGDGWTESTLWNFGSVSNDGVSPIASVIIDNSGNLFGTTSQGGANSSEFGFVGTAFQLTPPSSAGGPWTESTIWNFGKGKDGQNPRAGVIMDQSGNLYGTTFLGGVNGVGTVFSLTPPRTARGKWTETIVWNFRGNPDGVEPAAGLIADPSGNFYGTTQKAGDLDTGRGTVFEVSSVLTASPATLNFGNVVSLGTSKPKKVKLTNKGTLPAHISTLAATAPFTIASGGNTCSGEIVAPKKTCTFSVEFSPTNVGPASSGSIDVTYNGTSPAVGLSGTGISGKK